MCVSSYRGKVYRGEDGDDQEADDDGGDAHVEGFPPQPPGAIVVLRIVAVLGLQDATERGGQTVATSTLSTMTINYDK